MRVYLDNCCLQRPLDNQTQARIRVETEAVFAVLAAVQSRQVTLAGSGDYSAEREQLFTGGTVKSIVAEIKAQKAKGVLPIFHG